MCKWHYKISKSKNYPKTIGSQRDCVRMRPNKAIIHGNCGESTRWRRLLRKEICRVSNTQKRLRMWDLSKTLCLENKLNAANVESWDIFLVLLAENVTKMWEIKAHSLGMSTVQAKWTTISTTKRYWKSVDQWWWHCRWQWIEESSDFQPQRSDSSSNTQSGDSVSSSSSQVKSQKLKQKERFIRKKLMNGVNTSKGNEIDRKTIIINTWSKSHKTSLSSGVCESAQKNFWVMWGLNTMSPRRFPWITFEKRYKHEDECTDISFPNQKWRICIRFWRLKWLYRICFVAETRRKREFFYSECQYRTLV